MLKKRTLFIFSKELLQNKFFLVILFPIILMILTAVFTPIGQSIIDYFKPEYPSFVIVNYITRPDSLIIIESRNKAANKKVILDVEFDGIKLKDAATPVDKSNPQKWKINLTDCHLPEDQLKDGAHYIKFGFKGKPFSEELKVVFNTQSPIVNVEIQKNNGDLTGQTIKVKAATTMQIPEDTLRVDVFYYYNGQKQTQNLPVKRVVQQETGNFYFEFETTVQGLPKIDSKNPDFSKPFFALMVSDQAGNKYYQIQSYAEYMAPGDKIFGVNSIADIKVAKRTMDGQILSTVFHLTPIPRIKKLNDDGTPTIILTVTNTAKKYRELEWKTTVKDVQPLTLIYKNDKNIGTSFSNRFRELSTSMNDNAKYRVEKKSTKGEIIYSSKEVKAITYNDLTDFILDNGVYGMVYVKEQNGLRGQGRIYIEFFDNDSKLVARVLSESDGYFSFLGLKPGRYMVRINQSQLQKLNLISNPISIPVVIEKKYLDSVGGINFVLKSF